MLDFDLSIAKEINLDNFSGFQYDPLSESPLTYYVIHSVQIIEMAAIPPKV